MADIIIIFVSEYLGTNVFSLIFLTVERIVLIWIKLKHKGFLSGSYSRDKLAL